MADDGPRGRDADVGGGGRGGGVGGSGVGGVGWEENASVPLRRGLALAR